MDHVLTAHNLILIALTVLLQITITFTVISALLVILLRMELAFPVDLIVIYVKIILIALLADQELFLIQIMFVSYAK